MAKDSPSNSKDVSLDPRGFYDQMEAESDRGAVIVSVSLLDELLCNLLKAKLLPSLEKCDELFESAFSPFSSFSAKIDLAYRLGIIGHNLRSSLHLLRKLRNDFAHASIIKGFDHPSTQNRIRELVKLNTRILDIVTEIVGDAEETKDFKIESTKDLLNKMSWRGILQLIFTTLAIGMSDNLESIKPLSPLPDKS